MGTLGKLRTKVRGARGGGRHAVAAHSTVYRVRTAAQVSAWTPRLVRGVESGAVAAVHEPQYDEPDRGQCVRPQHAWCVARRRCLCRWHGARFSGAHRCRPSATQRRTPLSHARISNCRTSAQQWCGSTPCRISCKSTILTCTCLCVLPVRAHRRVSLLSSRCSASGRLMVSSCAWVHGASVIHGSGWACRPRPHVGPALRPATAEALFSADVTGFQACGS